MEGRWRQCVEALRHCLAALVGKRAEDEDDLADVQAAIKDANRAKNSSIVGYNERSELVRRALKFYCDLGGHPEVAETQRSHAHSALVMTTGLLESFRS